MVSALSLEEKFILQKELNIKSFIAYMALCTHAPWICLAHPYKTKMVRS